MKKTVYKRFALWQAEDEEKWLNSMSAEGWQLVKNGRFRYQFEQGKPNEYIYKLELLENDAAHQDSQSYISFLEDTGIEKIGECSNWIYLRRKTEDGPFEQSNSPVRKLKYALRLYFSLEKIRNIFIMILAIFLLLSQMAARIDYSSNLFDFVLGMINGIAMGSAVLLIFCTPYYHKLRKQITVYTKEAEISE